MELLLLHIPLVIWLYLVPPLTSQFKEALTNSPPNATYWGDLSSVASTLNIPAEQVPTLSTDVILASLPNRALIPILQQVEEPVLLQELLIFQPTDILIKEPKKMSAGFIITGTEDLKVYIKAEKSQEVGITLSNPSLEVGMQLEPISCLKMIIGVQMPMFLKSKLWVVVTTN